MADIKSLETLLSEIKTFLRSYLPGIDTGDNSLMRDLVLLPFSIGGKAIMDQVEIARDLSILSRVTGSDLDNEGTNYKLERSVGNYSTVTLTFFTTIEPTAAITIPTGSQVQTAGTSFESPITFSTSAQTDIPLADVPTYFSYDRNRWEFPVTAICDIIGTDGNVSAENITQLVGAITGISGVTNRTASTGGLDEELNDDFRERIQLAITGRDLNTVNGLRQYTREAGFIDAYPVRTEDTDSERATGIDVFVITTSSAAYSEIFTYDPAQVRYYFTQRPVLALTSIRGPSGTLTSAQYNTNLDNSSPVRRSIYSSDYVRILAAASLVAGDAIEVTYNYVNAIAQVQGTFDEDDNNVLTADPLIKRGYPMYLYITATLTLKANADGPTTRTTCKNAIAQWLSTFRLGDDLQKSDLIIVMQQGYGDYPIVSVDAVVISSYYLQDEFGAVTTPINEIIAVGNKQYVVYGATTLI